MAIWRAFLQVQNHNRAASTRSNEAVYMISILLLLSVVLYLRSLYILERARELHADVGRALWLYSHVIFRHRGSARPKIAFIIHGLRINHMDLKVSQALPVAVKAVDRFGNPSGSFDAPPAFSLSDPSLAALEVAENGLSCLVKPSGPLGSLVLKCDAQSDGKPLHGELELNLVAGDAAALSLEPGQPVDQA